MNQEPTAREMGHYLSLAQTGVEMVLPAVGGHFLDQWLDTTPWITVIAAVVGFAAGLIHLIAILKKKDQEDAAQKKPPP
jgi:ATP synthase protein I